MQKNFREFLGAPIREKLSKGLVGKVEDFVINPNNGEILAFFAKKNRCLLLPTIDVSKITSGVIWVDNPEALAAPDEIIRISEVIERNTPIFKNKVFTVSRQYLGEVIDFRFEVNGWILTKIKVAKKILGIPSQVKLINSSQIIQIKSNEIIVRDAVVKVKAKVSKMREAEIMPNLTPATLQVKDRDN
jgi:uncharacterized protein YrrD